MWFSRLRCHFCKKKSPYGTSSTEFQCTGCEAHNYFDGHGNVVDPPATLTSHNTTSYANMRPQTFTRPLPDTLEHQQQQAFCDTCTQNQLLYNETLANYLPDESHPRYKEFEKAIPQYKAELEKRYPLICQDCASAAQSKINRADYYSLTQNAARLCADTRKRGGQPANRTRDDTGKKLMRLVLNLFGLVLFLGLFAQIVYHAYAILTLLFAAAPPSTGPPGFDDLDDGFDMTTIVPSPLRECSHQSLKLRFTTSCCQLFSNLISYTLAIAAVGLFYNPGLKAWYHHTYRYEHVKGQTNYFHMQLIALVVRSWAWVTLSDPAIGGRLDKQQIIAMHGFAIVFIMITQVVALRGIEPILWKLKGNMMPRPDEKDVLGQSAGPGREHYTPKASGNDPLRYLRKQDNGPFDINSLAPQYAKKPTAPSRSYFGFQQQPSPEYSEDDTDMDAMETDDRPVMRSAQSSFNGKSGFQPHTIQNTRGSSLGFNGEMTEEIFGMQNQMRQDQRRKHAEQQQQLHYDPPQQRPSPFYGQLPPAPMSMERRLRNPISRPLEPQQVPLSQQKNFMDQMRAGIKPVQFPQKGSNFEVRQSDWHLPSDTKELGLEDRFGMTFSLNDPGPADNGQKSKGGFFGFFGI